MAIGNEYGDDIVFQGFNLVVQISDDQFMPTSERDDLGIIGAVQKLDSERDTSSSRNTFGEYWFKGPAYTESFDQEFHLQRLTEAQVRLLTALWKLQRLPTNRTPIRLFNRRKVFEEASPRTRALITSPVPTIQYQVPGMEYYWAQYDVELIMAPDTFKLQRGPGCTNTDEHLYKGMIATREMRIVDPSEDVADVPSSTVLTP